MNYELEYGCIGEHLPHSFSREIHGEIGGYAYELKELTPEELPAFMTARQFRGINVTIPYKQAVIPFLDEIDKTAPAAPPAPRPTPRSSSVPGKYTGSAALPGKAAFPMRMPCSVTQTRKSS